MNRRIRKPTTCIGQNKCADQLHPSFRFTNICSTMHFFNKKFQVFLRPGCAGNGRKSILLVSLCEGSSDIPFLGLVICPDGLMGFPIGCRMDEDCLKLKRYCYKVLPGQLEDSGICCNQWLAYTSERKWNFHRLFEIVDQHIKQ